MSRYLSSHEAFCAQRQHNLINTGQPALALLDDLWIERGAGVPWHIDLYPPINLAMQVAASVVNARARISQS